MDPTADVSGQVSRELSADSRRSKVEGPDPAEAAPVAPARGPARAVLRVAFMAGLLGCGPGVLFGLVFATGQFYPDRAPPGPGPETHGLRVEAMTRVGTDGVTSAGWYIAPPGAPAPGILLLHGYGGRRDRMLGVAKFLHQAGFGISMMDLRHHGEAGDGIVTFGIREAESVRPYVDDLASRPQHAGAELGIMGCSLGAVTALRVASLDPRIAAVVADSPFDSLARQSRWALEKRLPGLVVPYFWFFTVLTGTVVTGLGPWEWEVGDWIPKILPRPMFFIHGASDDRIPAAATRRLLARAGSPPPAGLEGWVVEGAGHLDAMTDHSDEYASRITRFFREHLRGPPATIGPVGDRVDDPRREVTP